MAGNLTVSLQAEPQEVANYSTNSCLWI